MCNVRWANKKIVKKTEGRTIFGNGKWYREYIATERVLQYKNSDGKWVDIPTEDVVVEEEVEE